MLRGETWWCHVLYAWLWIGPIPRPPKRAALRSCIDRQRNISLGMAVKREGKGEGVEGWLVVKGGFTIWWTACCQGVSNYWISGNDAHWEKFACRFNSSVSMTQTAPPCRFYASFPKENWDKERNEVIIFRCTTEIAWKKTTLVCNSVIIRKNIEETCFFQVLSKHI